MNVSTHHDGRGSIEVRVPKTPGLFASSSTDGVLLVSMSAEQWIEFTAEVRRAVEREQLAAKIAEHGAAS